MDWNDSPDPYEPFYSKKRVIYILLSILVFVVTAIVVNNLAKSKGNNKEVVLNTVPDISKFVITNAYLESYEDFKKEYPATRINKPEHAKFLVMFYPAQPRIEDIEYIKAIGPDNYKIDFKINQKYNRENLNGYISNAYVLWFMVWDTRDFIKQGNYTIIIKYKDGTMYRKSRYVNSKHDFLTKYKELKKKFIPKGNIAFNKIKNGISFKWKTIPDMHLYYCFRLAQYKPGMNFADSKQLILFDNIFFEKQPEYGLNKSSVNFEGLLDKNVKYTWFVEITDSNRLSEVDLVIYQKFQYFSVK